MLSLSPSLYTCNEPNVHNELNILLLVGSKSAEQFHRNAYIESAPKEEDHNKVDSTELDIKNTGN